MSSHSDTPQSPILEVFDHLRNTDETPPNNPRIKDWVLQLPSPQFSIYEDQQPEIAAQTRDRPQEPFHILRHLTVTSPIHNILLGLNDYSSGRLNSLPKPANLVDLRDFERWIRHLKPRNYSPHCIT